MNAKIAALETLQRGEIDVATPMADARQLTTALVLIMSIQAPTGLLFQRAYRDADWITATWFGNDWVTLVAAVPLLIVGLVRTARGSVRGLLLWLGVIAYAIYNYAFYLFGAALNAFFLIYVAAFVLAVAVLILVLSRIDAARVANCFRFAMPVRFIGGSLVFVAAGLASVWMAMWAAYVFAGRPLPVEPETFRVVAALDLSFMVPILTIGGLLLWRRMPWGYVLASIASIQGALYLFVLSVNSIVAVRRSFANAPGELPVWGTLTVLMAGLALMLLANIRHGRAAVSTQSWSR